MKEETITFFGQLIKICHKTVGKKVKQFISEHKQFQRNLERTIAEEQGGTKKCENHPDSFMNISYCEVPMLSMIRYKCDECGMFC